jgi:ATP-dependent helicase/nuclease subunit B
VYRLEQDIILHENIARGLARYRKHLAYRLRRLPTDWTRQTAMAIQSLLNLLDQAAEPLREFLDGESGTPARMLTGLRDSLQLLGMWEAFEVDPAGAQLLEEWDRLYQAAQHSGLAIQWTEFRAWLGAALERHDYRPPTGDSPVVLLTLGQAWLGRFAGLVIGACNREQLPGTAAGSPFFNDRVRAELGLPVWPQEYQLRLHRFRCLLESAPRILLTWCREEAGESRLPSPWVEAVQTFHSLAWNDPLDAGELETLVNHPAAQVRGHHPLAAPSPATHPAPVLDRALVPHTLSASSHQRLIDCPYRFFAADGLRLKPREAVSEALEKSDYGERIHRCLEAFHGGQANLPGPFKERINSENRAAAIALLQQVSRAVFASDLEDNFEHRAWLKRWEALIPEYIDWEIRRQEHWTVARVEQQEATRLRGEDQLRGRLDRIDTGPEGLAIIDYKTGRVPRRDAVETGEAVQLPSYALLTATFPARVGYLRLDRGLDDRVSLEGEELRTLAGAIRERLITVLDAIENGASLPAWGDAEVCRHCEMDGICRQQSWLDDSPAPPGTGETA